MATTCECGASVPSDARFCPACGRPLSSPPAGQSIDVDIGGSVGGSVNVAGGDIDIRGDLVDCRVCGGTGKIWLKETCPDCGGKGFILEYFATQAVGEGTLPIGTTFAVACLKCGGKMDSLFPDQPYRTGYPFIDASEHIDKWGSGKITRYETCTHCNGQGKVRI